MRLPAEVEELIASLRLQIAALEAEGADLRRRLGQDSSNSSKPPSSDGLGKKPRNAGSLRDASGKASGGQKGHKGGTLRQVADPDCVVRHEACVCRHCHSPLEPKSAPRVEARQGSRRARGSTFRTPAHGHGTSGLDLPLRALPGREQGAVSPNAVVSPHAYGERLKAAAIYLNIQQLIPEDRTALALSDLIGAPLICAASIVAWMGKKAQELRQVYQRIGERVAEAKVRHLFCKAENLPNGNPALPHRFRRALHQQPGRTRPEDDEGQNENLRRVPNPPRRSDLRNPQIRRFNRKKAGTQRPPNPRRASKSHHHGHRPIANGWGAIFFIRIVRNPVKSPDSENKR
jgi:Family of unknown function (DUF6444)/Transposase IS66 family